MNILMTGGSGLIGRAVCKVLCAGGHRVTVLSRSPRSVEARCGVGVRAMGSLDEWRGGDFYDGVINLAGAPIVGVRWTRRRRQMLWDSRVALTDDLVAGIARAEVKPAVLLSGSAVGIYGDCGEREVCEDGEVGDDFGARLCQAWEQAASGAVEYGVRTCVLRTGIVLSREGGMLARLRAPFCLGLGARIGDGRQWMSWLHIDDQVAIIVKLLTERQHRGAFNLCAPAPVTNAAFTDSFAAALGCPSFLVAPAFAINAVLGEAAGLLLRGQKALPGKLEASGYRFRYPDLEAALKQLV